MSRGLTRAIGAVVVACAWAASAPAQPASQTLVMWGADAPPQGTVTALDMQGVSVMMGDGSSVTLDWTRVRDVLGARSEQFEQIRDDARAVWRAGVRLDRGDLINAEPLFEDLFERYGAQAGVTSSFVARGLLRCRLSSGARAPAIAPWLGALRAEGWSPGSSRSNEPGSMLDTETGLVPTLAPIWLGDEQTAWLARQGVRPSPEKNARPGAERMRLSALSTLYTVSALYETDPADRSAVSGELAAMYERADPETLGEPGVALVLEIVLSRVGQAEERASARTALTTRLRRRPPAWTEAWIRCAIGRSLVLESDAEVRRRGVIQLLHVPARFEAMAPGLASIALAEAAETMRSLGDDESGGALRRELLERFPDSEGARWGPIVDWRRGEGVTLIDQQNIYSSAGPGPATEGNGRS